MCQKNIRPVVTDLYQSEFNFFRGLMVRSTDHKVLISLGTLLISAYVSTYTKRHFFIVERYQRSWRKEVGWECRRKSIFQLKKHFLN